jgi:hypothetical protein
MVLGVALAGFAAFLLARRVSGDAATAGLAMVVYGAAPHLLGQAYNGISETVCAGWLPLTLFLLMRVIDQPRPMRGLLLGLSAGLCMGTSWYYGLFAAIAGLALLFAQATAQPEAVDLRRTAPALGLALLVAAVIVAPLMLNFRGSLEAADAIVSRDPTFVRASLMNHNITDAAPSREPGAFDNGYAWSLPHRGFSSNTPAAYLPKGHWSNPARRNWKKVSTWDGGSQ